MLPAKSTRQDSTVLGHEGPHDAPSSYAWLSRTGWAHACLLEVADEHPNGLGPSMLSQGPYILHTGDKVERAPRNSKAAEVLHWPSPPVYST